MERICAECSQPAARLRKGRCDACYMRRYRRGAPAPGDLCAACGERRLAVLGTARLAGAPVILCGNCVLVLERTRPIAGSLDDLRARARGRHQPERRAARFATPPAPAPLPPPPFDPSLD